ncbi:MAG: VWD domain-containing protein [Flavobacteriia bacterium]|jgi:hypothetical protein
MKKTILLIGILTLTSAESFGQNDRFKENFQLVKNELVKWDPIRGEWLASSLYAMSNKQPVPDRTFPENLTPAEMWRLVPEGNRSSVNRIVTENQRVATDTTGRNEWNQVASVVNLPNCKPVSGRTYGDPHLSSFDGASYSFQTVGEFVLAKSDLGNFEIQARQQPQTDDFSLNTAVAMNVAGDRVGIYANEKPDNVSTSALRVNGVPVTISRSAYFLPHGGTITYSSNTYVVTWPTGEVANVQLRNSSQMNFLNVTVQVFPCRNSDLTGLLGNANGSQNDDFDVRGGGTRPMSIAMMGNSEIANQLEKEHLAFLARDFARAFRVTAQTSLFDYGFGQSTLTYTDESFPRVHRTIGDLTPDRQTSARRICEGNGMSGADLNGCIFDQAYLDIPPNPRPVITDNTQGMVLGKIEKPAPNVNPGSNGVQEISKDKTGVEGATPQTISKPSGKTENKESSTPEKPNTSIFNTEPKPSKGTTIKPGNTTKPTSTTPKPIGTPAMPSSTPIKTSPTVKPGKG